MADSPVLPIWGPAIPLNHGRHYERIKKIIPPYLIAASAELRSALRQVKPSVPRWHRAATQAQRDTLNTGVEARLTSQKRLETILSQVQPLNDFAQPLLEQALKTAGFTLPVNDVFVHLFSPVFDAFGLRAGGFTSRTLSLLQAALHNFEAPETTANYFGPDSGFITRPDTLGRYAPYATSLTVEAFTSLCRQLDIGRRYQEHLNLYLTPQGVLSQGRLEGGYINHQKAMLKVDAQIALLKGDIDTSAYDLLARVIQGEREIKTGEQQVWYRYPCVMGLLLKGCVVFDLCVKDQYSDAIIVWIPGDPEHPLKKYASYFDFRDELLHKLTPATSRVHQTELTVYQQFLSRFFAQTLRRQHHVCQCLTGLRPATGFQAAIWVNPQTLCGDTLSGFA